ncbi:MAG: type II toxin-antitoxin system RelE/ParE family toxin [Patescibacteria group bacterium]
MAIKTYLYNNVEKSLKRLPRIITERFYKTLDLLTNNPLAGMPLKGTLKGYRKYRIGDYRIVYKYQPKEKALIIYRIESRQSAYKN